MKFQVSGSVVLVLGALAASAGDAAQDAQRPPRFQSGVDLITLEVAVTDSGGRPVEDLRARDFTVKIDGKTRQVVSAELIRIVRGAPAPPAATTPGGALISTNTRRADGRLIAIAVDQTLITPGSIKPLLLTASRFVDRLTPQDYGAVVTFPEPGPRVDFTRDRARLLEALDGIVGQPARVVGGRMNPSLSESVAIHERERIFLRLDGSAEEVWATAGPMMRRVLERGACHELTVEELQSAENAELLKQCLRELGNEAMMRTVEARQEATVSMRRLESFVRELIPIEGRKTMVLISAGLVADNLALLDEVSRLAAAARTSINVIAVEPQRDRSETIVGFTDSAMELQDRQYELTALETIADRTGGTFFRAAGGNGEGIFERLASELSAWYVVAVERQRTDPERQRVNVEVRRRGVTVRANRMVAADAAVSGRRNGIDLLREAISSPIPVTALPLRLSTFTQRDAETGTYRLHFAAQVGQPGTPSGEFTVGYVVMDEAGGAVASLRRTMTLDSGGADQLLTFDTAVRLEPGVYSLRFGVVDADGRRGTIVRPVELEPVPAGLATSDLFIGRVPAEGDALRPVVEPRVADGRLAAYLELYPPEGNPRELTVTLEIAEGDASPALVTQTLNVGAASQAYWRAASGAVDVNLLPGRYIARAWVRDGDEIVRIASRPFVVAPGATAPVPATRVRGAPLPPEMQRRTAAYVATVVRSLANVVAQEDFQLGGRRVTSDFLLVRYPGSNRDLLTFRDVTHLNGVEITGRAERLTELFFRPLESIRDRVRDITIAAEDFVPATLNPMFVVAFLQEDFQPRFQLTVSDAGPEWPPQVKAVSFVETARPTLLRAGVQGVFDVPASGTAWVEETTGRILETELQLGTGRSRPTVRVRFKLDERLQIMVPATMRSENPDGVATYSNFRRFTVRTDAGVAPDQR